MGAALQMLLYFWHHVLMKYLPGGILRHSDHQATLGSQSIADDV
jgi:hypothetical protein